MVAFLIQILSIPVELSMQLLEAIKKEVDKAMLGSVPAIREKMFELQLLYDLNKISKVEYDEAMKYMGDKLAEIRDAL